MTITYPMDYITPYFKALMKEKRMCPVCHKPTHLTRSGENPNGMFEDCDACGWFELLSPPVEARVPYEPEPLLSGWTPRKYSNADAESVKTNTPAKRPEEQERGKIIRFEDIRR